MPGAVTRFFNDLQVFDVEGYTKVRVGRHCDGGYVVLDELCPNSTLYSYGIGYDISFEVDFINRYQGSSARCFDHTIDRIPTDDPRIKFYKQGLGSGQNCKMPRMNIDLDNSPKVLKVDVEHHEWNWLSRWFDHYEFHQIVIELHILPICTTRPWVPYLRNKEVVTGELSPYFQRMFKDFDSQVNDYVFSLYECGLARLLRNYRVFHIHGNNSLPKAQLEGHEWPQLLELSLVRADTHLKFTPTTQTFPVPGLDFPNKANRPDFKSILPFKCTT